MEAFMTVRGADSLTISRTQALGKVTLAGLSQSNHVSQISA